MCNSLSYSKYRDCPCSSKLANVHSSRSAYEPTKLEHIANVATHAVWIVPSFFGFYRMLQMSDTLEEYVVISLYGICLISLFSISTVFHYFSYARRPDSSLRNAFHLCDRAVIYLFIAASYTPWFVLRDFHGGSVRVATAGVWLAAFSGILFQYRFHERFKWLEIMFYICLGVLPAIVTVNIKDTSGLFDMAYGGAIYILGVFFFKADGILPCAHAVWHCFVTAGALVHYRTIYYYLLD